LNAHAQAQQDAFAMICRHCSLRGLSLFTAVRSRFLALRPRTRAVLYMMMMVLLFAMLETIAKYLSQSYPVPMIAWGRYTVHLLLMLVLFAPRMGRDLLRTTQPGAQILRASLLMGSTLFAFSAPTCMFHEGGSACCVFAKRINLIGRLLALVAQGQFVPIRFQEKSGVTD
jgi:hypothetical protein